MSYFMGRIGEIEAKLAALEEAFNNHLDEVVLKEMLVYIQPIVDYVFGVGTGVPIATAEACEAMLNAWITDGWTTYLGHLVTIAHDEASRELFREMLLENPDYSIDVAVFDILMTYGDTH